MNGIIFKTKPALRIYNDYMKRIGKSIAILSESDRTEILMELNSHIYEGTLKCTSENEVDVLLDVIDRLGIPEEFLKPLVAKRKLEQAVSSFRPKDVYQAIKLNIRNGSVYSVFGLLYLLLFSFIFLIVFKIISPANTGLFYDGDTFRGFGYIKEVSGLTEILDYWLIPIALLTALAAYFCITLLLRITRKR